MRRDPTLPAMHRDGPSLVDEHSWRLVEWFVAGLAVVAAVLIGIR